MRYAVLLLVCLVLGWHGMSAPVGLEGPTCACDDDEASHVATDGLDEHEGAHETAPPDCEDDCLCCGAATMVAGVPSVWIRPPAPSAPGPRVHVAHAKPSGEHDGVYRPPRA